MDDKKPGDLGLPKDVWLQTIFSTFNIVELRKIARTCRFFKECTDALFPTAPWPPLLEPYTLNTNNRLQDTEYKPICIIDNKIFIVTHYGSLFFIALSDKPYTAFSRYYEKQLSAFLNPCNFLLVTHELLISCSVNKPIAISEYKNNECEHKQLVYSEVERETRWENRPRRIAATKDGKTLFNIYQLKKDNEQICQMETWHLDQKNFFDLKFQLQLITKLPHSIVANKNDLFVLTSHDKKSISLWKLDDDAYIKNQEIKFNQEINFVYISSNNELVISADQLYILLLDKTTNEYQQKFTFSANKDIFTSATNLEQSILAVGSATGNIHILRLTTTNIKELIKIKRENSPIHYLGLTKNYELVSVTESKDKTHITVQSFPFLRLSTENDPKPTNNKPLSIKKRE